MKDEIQKMPSRATSDVAETAAGAFQPATIDQYVQTDNSGINTVFDIDLPYTIPSDGQQHNVAIGNHRINHRIALHPQRKHIFRAGIAQHGRRDFDHFGIRIKGRHRFTRDNFADQGNAFSS